MKSPSKALVIIGLVTLLIVAVGSRSASHASEAEVLTVVKTLTDGWREADLKKVESTLHPEFRLVTLRESATGPETQLDTREHLIESVKRLKAGTWDDRLRDAEVRIDQSGIATVWVKYEFYINGKRSHCGIESFQLYRMSDGWKIINFADTHNARFCGK